MYVLLFHCALMFIAHYLCLPRGKHMILYLNATNRLAYAVWGNIHCLFWRLNEMLKRCKCRMYIYVARRAYIEVTTNIQTSFSSSPVWAIYHHADETEGVSLLLLLPHVGSRGPAQSLWTHKVKRHSVRLCKVVGWRAKLHRSEVVVVKIENDAFFLIHKSHDCVFHIC